MSKFKKVFKGYDMAEVDTYVKEIEQKVTRLERENAGKPIVSDRELSMKEAELLRKQRILDSTYKVFFELVQNRLSKEELSWFLVVADSIKKMNSNNNDEPKVLSKPQKQEIAEIEENKAELASVETDSNEIENKNAHETQETTLSLTQPQVTIVEQESKEIVDDGAPLIDLEEINNPSNSLSLEDLCKDVLK